ncbi:hypothetical protein KBC04_00800 [Candidatus Babeliales bacterium]|nr:hypothetical protein [Candidatus Babeliales bacterium]MBP9843370.1 hypothetical protein [Candidatus Babeliales bacterium]
MKKNNSFSIQTLIFLVYCSTSYATSTVEQEKQDVTIVSDSQTEAAPQEKQDELIQLNGQTESFHADQILEPMKSSQFVKYDELQRMKSIESLPLQQQGGDMIESVAFNFEDIDLHNVAEYMERVHKVKFIMDEILDTSKGPKLAGNKISYRTNAPLSKKESWDLFITFLSMAGLDVVPMSHAGFYKIVPLPNASQEALPAYIGSNHLLLPDNDMMIRYIYFMQNGDPFKIQPLISKFQGTTGSLMVYKDLKALIFTDKSYNIKSLMTIVKELDKPISPQALSVIKLKRANVEDVINLYNSLKPTSQGQQRAWAPDNKDSAGEFFSQNITLAGDKRTNTLIILGPKEGVARFEDFIEKHIDIVANTTKSPVFVYYLQYTNATDMQKTISQLVSYGSSTSAGQYGGVRDGQKYLQPMTIVADVHSNSLIINSTPEDYPAVEKLIKDLDVAQKQIALEVLIVQVTGTKVKELGSQISGPNATNTFLRTVSAQTSGIPPASGVVVTGAPNNQGTDFSIKSSLANLLLGPINQTGSTLLTLGQPIWAIFKVLKTITSTKILQNPFIVVSNNSKGFCKVGTSRRVVTGEAISAGNTAATGYQTAEANMSITIVPQVNDQGIINLAIQVDNNQFVNNSANDAVQDQKSITTMAAVADGEVLVLGGIMADSSSSSTSGVPLFSKIPLFGWLFKNKASSEGKNIFIVFICPKILDNVYSQADVQEYTRNKIEEAQDYLRLMDEAEDLNAANQDPIDKMFFGARESRSDDLTSQRLLHRGELVSHHEKITKEPVGDGKVANSKYHKKARQTAQTKTQEKTSSVQKKKIGTKYSSKAAPAKVGKNKTIDMSEKQVETKSPSISSIKNMVQMSSGVTL